MPGCQPAVGTVPGLTTHAKVRPETRSPNYGVDYRTTGSVGWGRDTLSPPSAD